MDNSIFFIIILSHVIFDFVLQGEYIVALRKGKNVVLRGDASKNKLIVSINTFVANADSLIRSRVGNCVHSIIHFCGIYIITFILIVLKGQPIKVHIMIPIFVAVFHYFIDIKKSKMIIKDKKFDNNIWIFLLDQFLHLVAIVVIYQLVSKVNILQVFRYKILNYPVAFSLTEKLLIVGIIVFTATWTTGIFIRILIGHLGSKHKMAIQNNSVGDIQVTDEGAPNGGFIIGILERFFILVSLGINFPAMIGFVLTAKSVARFKKLSDESFAEYFIIGTFLSFISAVLAGIIIRSLFV